MFQAPKSSQQSISSYTQLDQRITAQLAQKPSVVNFKIIGSSNGIVMDTLFKYKSMVFINAVVVDDGLVFDLCIVSLQMNENVVRKIPLVYGGTLVKSDIERATELASVEIQMQQAPKEEYILAVKISIIHKGSNQSKDTLSILVLNPNQLAKPDIKMLSLLKLKCGDQQIYDFSWHPLSNLTILVLGSSQNLQIWDLNDEDFLKPSHTMKIRNFKNNYKLSLDAKFTRFATLTPDSLIQNENSKKDSQNLNFNKYTLFLMNSIGEIISLYPFLPMGSFLTKQEYDNIYDESENSKQKSLLILYLNNCQITFNEEGEEYIIISTPVVQNHYQVQKWFKSHYNNPNINDTLKLSKEQYYYEFKLFPLPHNCILVLQVMHEINYKQNCIWINIINKQVQVDESIEADNVIYPIAKIRNELKNAESDFRFISSDSKANKLGLSKYKSLFYTQASKLYKIDLSAVYKFMETNNLRQFQEDDCFPVTLIFELNENESIVAMAAQQSLNSINFIRRTKNKIKFQIQPLGYLNAFLQIESISRLSNELLRKLNNLRMDQIDKPLSKEKQQENQLPMNAQNIKKYQEKGLEEVKKDYTRYCDNIKNNIDHGMSELKKSYEIMRKRLRNFKGFKDKREELNRLLEQVQINNDEINTLLFDKSEVAKIQAAGELGEMQMNINSLNSMLETAKKKNLSIKPEAESQMIRKIDELFDKLRSVRINLEEARKMKREIESSKA